MEAKVASSPAEKGNQEDSQGQWGTTITPATQVAEAETSQVQSQPGQLSKQKKTGHRDIAR